MEGYGRSARKRLGMEGYGRSARKVTSYHWVWLIRCPGMLDYNHVRNLSIVFLIGFPRFQDLTETVSWVYRYTTVYRIPGIPVDR